MSRNVVFIFLEQTFMNFSTSESSLFISMRITNESMQKLIKILIADVLNLFFKQHKSSLTLLLGVMQKFCD